MLNNHDPSYRRGAALRALLRAVASCGTCSMATESLAGRTATSTTASGGTAGCTGRGGWTSSAGAAAAVCAAAMHAVRPIGRHRPHWSAAAMHLLGIAAVLRRNCILHCNTPPSAAGCVRCAAASYHTQHAFVRCGPRQCHCVLRAPCRAALRCAAGCAMMATGPMGSAGTAGVTVHARPF